MNVIPNSNFWQGKKVLITGHTGFKGSWLTLWLNKLGAKIFGISLPPAKSPNLYEILKFNHEINSFFQDIRDYDNLKKKIHEIKPEIVIHLAAQALVRPSYQDPVATFATNTMGTVNLLDSLRGLDDLKVALMVTSDKVYLNNENKQPFKESDRLSGHDPYSASKAASEIIIESYRKAFLSSQNIAIASARAGNVIGGGDWSQDRLIPDAIRAWQKNELLEIRNPEAVRPWQHVVDCLAGYLILIENLWNRPNLMGAFNFGPDNSSHANVRNIIDHLKKHFKNLNEKYIDTNKDAYEANFLMLDASKAKNLLNYKSVSDVNLAIERSALWYKSFYSGADPRALCEQDIKYYMDEHEKISH